MNNKYELRCPVCGNFGVMINEYSISNDPIFAYGNDRFPLRARNIFKRIEVDIFCMECKLEAHIEINYPIEELLEYFSELNFETRSIKL